MKFNTDRWLKGDRKSEKPKQSNEARREGKQLEDAACVLPGPEEQWKKHAIEAIVWQEPSGQTGQLG